ncbi:MAG: S41 family peptidase [Acidimicrobiia bacterium]
MRKTFAFVVLLALLLTACTSGGSSTSTAGDATTTTSKAAIDSGSTVGENGRILETVGCADAHDEVSIVCEAYDIIERNYVDEVSDATLAEFAVAAVSDLDGTTSDSALTCPLPSVAFNDACNALPDRAEDSVEGAETIVRGMAAALDPNSIYLDADAVELIEEEQEGQIEGIGALVTAEDSEITEGNSQCSTITETCRMFIVSIIEGSPAEAAGVESGDFIVGVNGEPVEGWTLDEVTARVRGPAGTDVDLTFERESSTYDVTITRAAVVIPVVTSDQFDDIGYVRLNVFSDNADEQLASAIIELLAGGISELVFDMRDNPGGLLDTAIEVTSLFLPDGEVVVTQNPDGDRSFAVTGDLLVPEAIPVVVIINKGSASASEVVSAVLQERGRATLIGESSFGKNTVQQQFTLSNGGAFKLTIARWVTPELHDFGGDGVTPDVLEEVAPDLDTEAVARLAASVN